jgi:transcriptional regulator NrdR family protein
LPHFEKLGHWKSHFCGQRESKMSKMYCRYCKGITEVKVTGMSKQALKEKRTYVKRVRTCQSCNKNITTIEVEENLIKDLEASINLINKISDDIKKYNNPLIRRLRLIKK